MPGSYVGVEADREKDGLGAVRGERGQDRRRVLWPGPVVESKHNLPFAQEVMRFEMLEAEAGATRGVDLDYARDTECIGITWTRRGHVRHRGGSWRRCGGGWRGRRRLGRYRLGRICDEGGGGSHCAHLTSWSIFHSRYDGTDLRLIRARLPRRR